MTSPVYAIDFDQWNSRPAGALSRLASLDDAALGMGYDTDAWRAIIAGIGAIAVIPANRFHRIIHRRVTPPLSGSNAASAGLLRRIATGHDMRASALLASFANLAAVMIRMR